MGHRVEVQINVMGWVVLKHPAYSPDLSARDFHAFGTLEKGLKGIHIGSQCAGGCGRVVRQQIMAFFADEIQ